MLGLKVLIYGHEAWDQRPHAEVLRFVGPSPALLSSAKDQTLE